MHITASVVMDYPCIKAFYRAHTGGKRKISNSSLYFGIISAIGFTAMLLLTLIVPSNLSTLILYTAFVLFIEGFLHLFRHVLMPRSHYRALGRLADVKNSYLFFEDRFEAITDTDGIKGSSSFAYANLFKVMETDRYLYLYQNKIGAYIIDKATLDGNEGDILQETLKKFVPKYVRCKY